MSSKHPFKWRHFLPKIILLNVRWYCRYSLSYRDLEEMMLERGIDVDHTTIHRWVQAYAPELDKAGEARTLNNIGTVYSDLGEKQQALNYGCVAKKP